MVNIAEARLYDHVNQLLAGHERLISDAYRNRSFYKAIKKNLIQGSNVLDIGSGTGIWAIVAAKLGAKKVVAIEQDQLLIGLIKKLASDNGVADRVDVIYGDSRKAQLDAEFDIVISETIGNLVFDEQIVPIMIDARERFLKPGGILIPESVALVAAPGHYKTPHKKLPAGIQVDYGYFESLLLHHPHGDSDSAGNSRLKLMNDAKDLLRADLRSIDSLPDLNDLTARWDTKDASRINCFSVWADMVLTKEIRMATNRTSSWTPTIYKVNPFKEEKGEIEFKLTLTDASNYWTATFSNGASRETQSYSPAIASTVLLAQTRADIDLMGHYKRMGIG